MIKKTLFATLLAAVCLMAANPKVKAAWEKAKAGKFEDAMAMLDPLHKANPKDAEVNNALAEVHLKYGDSFMFNESLPPRQKYAPALKQYRQVLVYDAANKDAKSKIATIEAIYKQMGRPIPQ